MPTSPLPQTTPKIPHIEPAPTKSISAPETPFSTPGQTKVANEEKMGTTSNSNALRNPGAQTNQNIPDKNTPKLHDILHKPKHDDSFWMGLITVLTIPILLLLALFEIIVKAAPWATGQ